MKEAKQSKAAVCICGIFVLLGFFMLMMGCMIISRQPTAGIVMLIIGLVVALFFGAGLVVILRPESKAGKYLAIGIAVFVGVAICLAVVASMFYAVLVQPFVDMEHYRQVWQSPVTVTARVVDIERTNDEGNVTYHSYITYEYDGVRYERFSYDNRSRQEDLLPVGSMVEVQISPKDPAVQISRLKRSDFGAYISVLLLGLGLGAVFSLPFKWRTLGPMPDQESIKKDVKNKIRSRYARPALLFCLLGFSLLYWRYGFTLGYIPLIVAGAFAVGWLICMYRDVRDYRYAKTGDYYLEESVVVDKTEPSGDADEGRGYYIRYECGARSWRAKVSFGEYLSARVGQKMTAVFLGASRKPILQYRRYWS